LVLVGILSLTPDPSPSRITGIKPQALMAGEGSIEERGRSPLSNYFPLLNIIKMEYERVRKTNLFERGIKGVSKRTTCAKNLP
jgi:hypothetical protein